MRSPLRTLDLVVFVIFSTAAAMHGADRATTPTLTTLYTFLNSPTDGSGVNAELVVDASGNLYGTTISGGPSTCNNLGLPPGCGIVFKLTPPATGSGPYTETILHAFLGDTDGANPQSTIVKGPGGSWYGTTNFGGTGSPGLGTIFELTPVSGGAPWTYDVLIRFSNANGGGYVPENNFTYYNGNLYTTTQNGGQFGNFGTVIELAQQGSSWSYNIIHSFDGTDGNGPQAALTVDTSTGTFYGVAQNGGTANQGTIFQLIPPASGSSTWTFNKLYDFTGGTDGGYIYGTAVLGPGGVLYGTAQNFGQYGKGTLWTLTPNTGGGWTFKVIHQFSGSPSDGATPVSNVVVTSKGVIYGTTELGGAHDKGTLLRFAPNGSGGYTEAVLWSFTGGTDGAFPFAAPTFLKANELVGSCTKGGSANAGVVWKVTF
jgi:uncharacterized repeat protein (TIGR03803 family)